VPAAVPAPRRANAGRCTSRRSGTSMPWRR
jgi:hypothetical protein